MKLMDNQTTVNIADISQPEIKATKTIVKSRKRTSFEEFCVVNHMRPEMKAGFKIWLKGQFFHFDDEWKELYNTYLNRKLSKGVTKNG